MKNKYLAAIEDAQTKPERGHFQIGDSVEVHQLILDGQKERVQVFSGVVIARKHGGTNETFTVRRIVQGEGVERIFPVHSPRISKIEVKRTGRVRRAKLFYLRDRVGKATRVREKKQKIGETSVNGDGAPQAASSKKGAREKKAKTEAAAE